MRVRLPGRVRSKCSNDADTLNNPGGAFSQTRDLLSCSTAASGSRSLASPRFTAAANRPKTLEKRGEIAHTRATKSHRNPCWSDLPEQAVRYQNPKAPHLDRDTIHALQGMQVTYRFNRQELPADLHAIMAYPADWRESPQHSSSFSGLLALQVYRGYATSTAARTTRFDLAQPRQRSVGPHTTQATVEDARQARISNRGVAGSGGVVLAYYDDPCSTVSGQLNSFQRGKSYTAFVAYATIQADAVFYTPTGSFQIAG